MRKLATLVLASSLFVSLLPAEAVAATPSLGVPLQVRRGFFTETDIGGFFTVGGDNGYSNFQIYLQLGLGYQLTINDGAGLIPIGVHVGIGTNAQNCWAGLKADMSCSQSDNFTNTFINASAGYLHRLGTGYVGSRLYFGGKLLGGVTLLDPRPIPDEADPTNTGLLVSPDVGAALSLEFATSVDHFSVGLDAAYRLIIGPNISSLMFYFRVQYTF
ncbi:MAG: adventurous gliding motility protein CglE [Myxococcaceae bacterium]